MPEDTALRPRLESCTLDTLRRLERFSVAALPARASWELPGWHCLADDGHVGRANSASPRFHPEPAGITEVAESYSSRGLPPLIRWTPLAPQETAARLAEEGWQSGREVLVLTRSLEGGAAPREPSSPSDDRRLELHVEAPERWRTTYASAYEAEEGAARLRLALEAPDSKRFAVLTVAGDVAGVGLGVSFDRTLGVFDVLTRPEYRRRGVARQVVEALLAWGAGEGADLAFLQVASGNGAALELYRKLGFTTAYTYVYAAPTLDST